MNGNARFFASLKRKEEQEEFLKKIAREEAKKNYSEIKKIILKEEIAKYTSADVLPLRVAENGGRGPITRGFLDSYNIQSLKTLMKKTDEFGIPLVYKIDRVGKQLYSDLLILLNFYDQQVERVIDYNKEYNSDETLFFHEYDRKIARIEDNEREIYNYLFDYGKDYIFGSITDNQKERIYSAIRGSKRKEGRETLNRLNEVIADYTILPELDNLDRTYNVKKKTLSRFITTRTFER